MRVLLTGGAGFIGSHVADALLRAGNELLIVDDLSTGKSENVPAGAALAQVDIRDANALARSFADFSPDVVSHHAAQTSVAVSTREPVRDADINVIGTLRVIEACVAHDVQRLVFASTGGAIYGEVAEDRLAEVGDPLHPLSPYACSKLAGEHYLQSFAHERGLSAVVLRYANVYGPRQDPHGEAGVVAIFAQRLIAGERIRVNARTSVGDAGCVRDYVMVDDVVRANLAAVTSALDVPVLNVCTGVATSTLDIATGLQRALGLESSVDFGPRRDGDLERSVLDPAPMIARLGTPVSLALGLQRTADWFREHRP